MHRDVVDLGLSATTNEACSYIDERCLQRHVMRTRRASVATKARSYGEDLCQNTKAVHEEAADVREETNVDGSPESLLRTMRGR